MTTERYRQQAEDFITQTMQSEIPDVAVDSGSAINSLIVRGGGAIMAALFQEIDHVIGARDISDPEALSTDDMDRNMEVLLVSRDSGTKSRGFVNIHFSNRGNRAFGAGTRVADADQTLFFLVEIDLSYAPSDHLPNASDGTFYLRVPFVAEKDGPEYDLDVGQITSFVDNQLGAIYIRNGEEFIGGLEAQTNTQLLRTAQRSVSTRTPLTIDGTVLALQQLFGAKLLDAIILGNGDVEMLRDELHTVGPNLALDPSGVPTGIHIGGRTDAYHWYPQVNYVQVDVDLTVDLVASSIINVGAGAVAARFAAGTTSTNAVQSSGRLILDLGGANEETVEFSSVAFVLLTGIYTFTITAPFPVFSHVSASPVTVSGDGAIEIGPDAAIQIVPVMLVKSVNLLDSLTLSPIGDPLVRVDPLSRRPGWYFEDFNKFNLMSAKETKTLRIDEKRSVIGNAPLSRTDGVVSAVNLLSSESTDFTGYQGRPITITFGALAVTRTILQVMSPTQVLYSAGPGDPLVAGSGRTFSVPAGYGDYIQYPIRVAFYTHTEIQEAQTAFDNGRTRIVCSDILSRAFYPIFLSFKLRYKGSGVELDVRAAILDVIQKSQGTILGANTYTRFDVSDIIAAAYNDDLADYVETPFQIKISRVNQDGTEEIRWVSPGPNTVNQLIVAATVVASPLTRTITCTRPAHVAEFAVPSSGRLFLGAFSGTEEELTYDGVVYSGVNITFVLEESSPSPTSGHPISEPLRVSVYDFNPDNVITDGTISDGRMFRPYFGDVIIEKIP